MRLSRIKIAGFKSFVDPTDLKLPSQRVGIVGPNGCGKSNTIDAVRWVMGESSAKHLRGESMDDVIFAGSSARQPVGQASVELIFDNSEGSLGGEYATFSEISIRREVTRDGQSRYLLNSVRCRRRDIRDIFLGTGLGPRSYAIIEQGMISRLIEAKPEDMRVYLEEAAGISKYKERRRETENRIRHTRENLERLDDLREEVDKQLTQLKRQATTAEKYRTLKAEAYKKRGELLLLRRREFEVEHDRQSVLISTLETELEAVISELRAAENAIELARAQQSEATDTFSEVQANYYRIGSELARLEQTIEHKTETRQQHHQELTEVTQNLDELMAHIKEDEARLAQIAASIENDEPAFNLLKDSQVVSAEHLVRAERELQQWQQRHEAFNRRLSESSRTADVERSRIEQFERNLAGANTRLLRLHEEGNTLDLEPLHAAIEEAVAEVQAASEAEEQLKASLARTSEHQQQKKEAIASTSAELDTVRGHMQTTMGRLSSLEALQQAALEESGHAAEDWLKAQHLDQAQRLAQRIHTEPGWEKATELVLGHFLEAVCLDDVAPSDTPMGTGDVSRLIHSLPEATLTLIEPPLDNSRLPADSSKATLGSQVSGAAALQPWLNSIYLADSPAEALDIRNTIAAHESVVTRCGVWLGPSWLRVARGENEDSVLLREGEITASKARLEELEQQASMLKARLDELNEQLFDLDNRRETQLHAFNDAVRTHSQMQSQLSAARQRMEQAERRQRTLNDELAEVQGLQEQDQAQLEMATAHRLEALDQLAALEQEKQQLDAEQHTLKSNLDQARQQRDADRDAGQELAIRVESMRSTRTATEQNLTRMQSRIAQLTERRDTLQSHLAAETDDTLEVLKAQLEQMLADKLNSDESLQAARQQLDTVESRLREHEQARQRADARAQSIRDKVQNQRMQAQEAVVRLKTLDEQLDEHEYAVAEIEAELDPEATIEVWNESLERLEKQIQRLGNINMAAIDQLAEQQQRKEYLDEQHLDVSEALLTLERAIAKIDRETRARFRDTFDQVNQKVQEFFPRLFGGGRGELQMTGDDLLSTGVNINAQPPGKRVSNIQLLSGGEKALTAVALVFAFFELNPSPFCMLDEVDAPLDDANVGRFCTLVKEMSERVQFIFITHNKVTMEMADQLMGVTMNEPGVSRLVAVDVQEAAELAGV